MSEEMLPRTNQILENVAESYVTLDWLQKTWRRLITTAKAWCKRGGYDFLRPDEKGIYLDNKGNVVAYVTYIYAAFKGSKAVYKNYYSAIVLWPRTPKEKAAAAEAAKESN